MLNLDAETLSRPPEEVARLLALERLEEAAKAGRRLSRREEDEALHDFRVGLRRLRSLLRAYRPYLRDSVRKKLRLGLKEVAQATGEVRDAEVQLSWVRARAPKVRGPGAAGVAWLSTQLEARLEGSNSQVARHVVRDFKGLVASLRRRLGYYKVRVQRGRRVKRLTFRSAAAALLREHSCELRDRLHTLRQGEREALHAARISAKRLRYLFEPFASLGMEEQGIVDRLKLLQDFLGEINDLHVFEPALVAARNLADRESPLALPGLTRLGQIAAREEQQLQKRLEKGWLTGQAEDLLQAIEDCAARLERGA